MGRNWGPGRGWDIWRPHSERAAGTGPDPRVLDLQSHASWAHSRGEAACIGKILGRRWVLLLGGRGEYLVSGPGSLPLLFQTGRSSSALRGLGQQMALQGFKLEPPHPKAALGGQGFTNPCNQELFEKSSDLSCTTGTYRDPQTPPGRPSLAWERKPDLG